MSTTSPKTFASRVRSNSQFKIDGLKKKIAYQVCLSTSRNPDFIVRHPNEMQSKNQDWKKEIIKRVTHEEEIRQKVLDVRLSKRTGARRVSA